MSQASVNSDDLTPEHAGQLGRGLFRGINFLVRLKTRMEKAGFTQSDPLYQLVCKAYDATHRLSVDLHHRSCASGSGRKSKTKTASSPTSLAHDGAGAGNTTDGADRGKSLLATPGASAMRTPTLPSPLAQST